MKIEIIKTVDGKVLVFVGDQLKQIDDDYAIKHYLIEQIKKAEIVKK